MAPVPGPIRINPKSSFSARMYLYLTLCVLSVAASGPIDAQTVETSKAPGTTPASLSVNKPPLQPIYNPNCQNPQDNEDAEFCDEMQATTATRKQVALAKWQLIANAIGILLVAGTLIYNAKATKVAVASVKAAIRSAKAAELAVKQGEAILAQAREATERQLRAYVLITKATISSADSNGRQITSNENGVQVHHPIMPGNRMLIQLAITNTGQTPANEVAIFGLAHIIDWPINSSTLTTPQHAAMEVPKTFIGRDNHIFKNEFMNILSEEDWSGLLKNKKAIVAYGEIHYKDIFNKSRITKYRLFTGALTIKSDAMSPHEDGNEAT